MISIEAGVSIARPPADVFAFVADVRNDPRWHTDVLEARLQGSEPIGVGSTFEITIKPAMGETGGTATVREYEPPRRVVFDVAMGKLRPTTTFTVVAEGDGSHITRRIEMPTSGLLSLMAPFMSGAMRKRNVGFLANLKRVLESAP
jgi:uncharacterized protein YndB with AHSA1/START domain